MQDDLWSGLAARFRQPGMRAADLLIPAMRAMARRPAAVAGVVPWRGRRGPPGRQERSLGPRLILHLAGMATLHHGEDPFAIVPGTVLLFPGSCSYGEVCPGPTIDVLIQAQGDGLYAQMAEVAPADAPRSRTLGWTCPVGGRSLEAGILLALADDLPDGPAASHRLAALRLVARLLLRLLESAPVPAVPALGPPMVRRVLGVINARGEDPTLGVAAIAAAVGMHPASLSRVTRTATGSSVLALLRRSRLDHVERLLADPRLKLAEIARRSGFGTIRRLRLAWRHEHKYPPSVVRRFAHRHGRIDG